MIDFGHGVTLETITAADLEKMRRWRNDKRIWRWCRQADLISPSMQAEWYAALQRDPTQKMYVIRPVLEGDAVSQTTVGVCGLTGIDRQNRRAEFSCYIGPEYQGRGYCKGALRTLLAHGFDNMGLNLIWGETLAGNPALELFKGLGFKIEGRRRQFYWKDGKYQDATLVSMTRGQWLARRVKEKGDEGTSDRSPSVQRDASPSGLATLASARARQQAAARSSEWSCHAIPTHYEPTDQEGAPPVGDQAFEPGPV